MWRLADCCACSRRTRAPTRISPISAKPPAASWWRRGAREKNCTSSCASPAEAYCQHSSETVKSWARCAIAAALSASFEGAVSYSMSWASRKERKVLGHVDRIVGIGLGAGIEFGLNHADEIAREIEHRPAAITMLHGSGDLDQGPVIIGPSERTHIARGDVEFARDFIAQGKAGDEDAFAGAHAMSVAE